MKIRSASPEDAENLLKIYRPYVTDTAVSFEYEVPSAEEFRRRIVSFSSRFPYLVAMEEDGRPIGYAYAHTFIDRRAYDWSVELTIYLDQKKRRQGAGRALYTKLEKLLKEKGIRNMYACIARPEGEDPYLTMDSILFHRRMGFEICGTFQKCGYKFDRWYDMVWMEKIIYEG